MKLDKLERLADAATPTTEEPWYDEDTIKQGIGHNCAYSTADAAFIAAANPTTIKAMCQLLRQCREAIERVGRDQYPIVHDALTALREFEKEQ